MAFSSPVRPIAGPIARSVTRHVIASRPAGVDSAPYFRALLASSKSDRSLQTDLEAWMPAAERAAKTAEENSPSFWSGAATADCMLARCLAQSGIDEYAQEIAEAYLNAKRRGASAKEWRSVMEHIEFLQSMASRNKSREGLANALKKLVSGLERKPAKTSDAFASVEPAEKRGRSKVKSGNK